MLGESALVEAQTALHDLVVKAVLGRYETDQQRAIPYWASSAPEDFKPDIVVPALRRAEEVETGPLPETAPSHWTLLRDRGFELWLLVPLKLLAESHRKFSDLADYIQPWWIEGGVLKFGEARLA
jgi:hypothetical protein